MSKRISRVFLVDDHPLVREWLTTLLNQITDLRVCGEAAGAEKAIEGIRATKPDIAIIDLALARRLGAVAHQEHQNGNSRNRHCGALNA